MGVYPFIISRSMARMLQTLDLDLKLISSENVISDGRLLLNQKDYEDLIINPDDVTWFP